MPTDLVPQFGGSGLESDKNQEPRREEQDLNELRNQVEQEAEREPKNPAAKAIESKHSEQEAHFEELAADLTPKIQELIESNERLPDLFKFIREHMEYGGDARQWSMDFYNEFFASSESEEVRNPARALLYVRSLQRYLQNTFVNAGVDDAFSGKGKYKGYNKVDGYLGAYTMQALYLTVSKKAGENLPKDLQDRAVNFSNKVENTQIYKEALDSLSKTAEPVTPTTNETPKVTNKPGEVEQAVVPPAAEDADEETKPISEKAEEIKEADISDWYKREVDHINDISIAQRADVEALKSGEAEMGSFIFETFQNDITKSRPNSLVRRAYDNLIASKKALDEFNKPDAFPGAKEERAALQKAYEDALAKLEAAVDTQQHREIRVLMEADELYTQEIQKLIEEYPLPPAIDLGSRVVNGDFPREQKSILYKYLSLPFIPGTGYKPYLNYLQNNERRQRFNEPEELGKALKDEQETYDFIEQHYEGNMEDMMRDFNMIIFLSNMEGFAQGKMAAFDKMQNFVATEREKLDQIPLDSLNPEESKPNSAEIGNV